MQSSALFELLTADDLCRLFAAGEERLVTSGEVLIEAGRPVSSLIIVMEGLLGVYADEERRARLAVIGPGDIVGDMSFIERRPPTESVVAEEQSRLLDLPYDALDAGLGGGDAFNARLYLGLARTLSRRLRLANSRVVAAAAGDEPRREQPAWRQVEAAVSRIKERLREADSLALKHQGRLPESAADAIVGDFLGFFDWLNDEIGDGAARNPRVKDDIGAWLQRELLPYIALTGTCDRMYSKPRGYAGDFLTIARIYENSPGGVGRLGATIDRAFLEEPPSVAVRNRRALLGEEIGRTIAAVADRPALVTSLACGPAAELFDVYTRLPDPARLKTALVDIDLQALAYVADRRDGLKLQKAMTLSNDNLVAMALGRSHTSIRSQDLVYSIGLIDYFSDPLVVRLIDLAHSMLAHGGRLILGNFHPRNGCKAFMDHVLEWRLVHRTEADMDRLFQKSAFGRPCTAIRFEPQGINLFAECVKGAD